MDKKSLNIVSHLVAFDSIPKAKKGEKFETYVKRAYPAFEKAVSKSENPIISEIEKDSADELKNAISKLEPRKLIVERFCATNDPFELEPPKEATTADILAFNDINGTEKELRAIMGNDGFDKFISKMKTPSKDGLSATEINRKRDEHYAEYLPALPSKKEYSHNSGGETRDYHWQASLQDEFVKDHNSFLTAYDLEDGFVIVESDTDAEGESETPSDEQE